MLAAGVIWLIVLYNQTVDIRHSISAANASYEKLQASNAELKDGVLKLFLNENFERLAEDRNLIIDKKPQYLRANTQWVFASQR